MSGNGQKVLVVNADDFGQSDGVTRGIIEAFERGIVTSTSMMVRWNGAQRAAEYARAHRDLAVGLHLDFGEWALRDDEWVQLYETVDLHDASRVAREAREQLERFRALLGCDPTHLDSHQHVHMSGEARQVAMALATELEVPLRQVTPAIAYCGSFYGQDEHGGVYHTAIGVPALVDILRDLTPGITELACHPGYCEGLDTMYRAERELELHTLCAPEVRDALTRFGVTLLSFRDLRDLRQ
jgi:predicted glycoside hydrolase/deacetylase ChbG (UPF0249 family)